MNANELFRNLNEIDDVLLERSEKRGKTIHWQRKALAVAAALIVCILSAWLFIRPSEGGERGTSLFVISVKAANGEDIELSKYASCFNSVPDSHKLPLHGFDAGTPLFRFEFKSAQWAGEKYPWTNHIVSFSYNGKVVNGRDEHLVVANTIPAAGYEGSGGYYVLGWFEEPTDIIITVCDRESGNVLEETTVNVRYVAEEDAYALTVTEVKTYETGK